MKFKERGTRGLVAFYLNGFADTVIEVLLNATQTVDQARAQEHADGFLNRKYPWKRYVLFNFAMKGDGLVLPRNQAMWNKTYTFVPELNCLYLGRTIITSPHGWIQTANIRRICGEEYLATRHRDGSWYSLVETWGRCKSLDSPRS